MWKAARFFSEYNTRIISMNIRAARPTDFDAIDKLIESAFATAEHSDGNEHNLVKALRKDEAYIPELSLVAEIENQVVGHIMFTRAAVGNRTLLALAPLSVLPNYQRQGIGQALIKEGHRIAKALGYDFSVVLGSEHYYPKMGYMAADTFGIKAPFDVPRENFMAYQLNPEAQPIEGTLVYAQAFGL